MCEGNSRIIGIPSDILTYKVEGKFPIGKRVGPKCIFDTEQENILDNWIFAMAKAGFPVIKCVLWQVLLNY